MKKKSLKNKKFNLNKIYIYLFVIIILGIILTGLYSYFVNISNKNLGGELGTSGPISILSGEIPVSNCMVLDSPNTEYKMVNNIVGTTLLDHCIKITADNITLDCNGYYIKFTSVNVLAGVYSDQVDYTTVKNCNVSMGIQATGIYYYTTSHGLMDNNTVNDNRFGIFLQDYSNNNTIMNITSNNNSHGIYLETSSNNKLENIIVTNSTANGIYLYFSNNNTLINNTGISNSSYGIYLYSANNNTLISNNGTSNSSYGILLQTSDNNILINNTGTSNLDNGIYIWSGINNNLTSNIGTSNRNFGILIADASNNTLNRNTGTSNSNHGIYLYSWANNNLLINNIGISNSSSGISLKYSNNNTLLNNNGTSNFSYGIFIELSNNNTLINNAGFSNSQYGIYIVESSNNILKNNIGTSNTSLGTYIVRSNNNFIENPTMIGYFIPGIGLRIKQSNNTIFKDCINISGTGYDVLYDVDAGSVNNTFINCSYKIDKETVSPGNELIRKWYYQAYTNYINGTYASSINVTGFNSSLQNQFNFTTNENGWTNITEVIDYVNIGGVRQYYSNYIINATNGSLEVEHIRNISLEDNIVPDIFTFGSEPVINNNAENEAGGGEAGGGFTFHRNNSVRNNTNASIPNIENVNNIENIENQTNNPETPGNNPLKIIKNINTTSGIIIFCIIFIILIIAIIIVTVILLKKHKLQTKSDKEYGFKYV